MEEAVSLSQRRTHLIGRLRHRKTREREGLVLAEGIRSVREALAAGAEPQFAVVSPRLETLAWGADLLATLRARVGDVETVGDSELDALADTERPQGVLAVFRQPGWDGSTLVPGGRYLVLDSVQDPGNVGTLVRAATAFRLDGVVALDGTADPWGPKAVRSSAGLAFRMPVLQVGADEAVDLLAGAHIPVMVADAAGTDVATLSHQESWALAVGNEGAGVREALRAAARRLVRIPMPGPVESLNAGVAGAILLYALTREPCGGR
ncbi:MAG: RNA methyltransferase [Gemmatimonadetes bacterium]|nr:RNA methyltransferase [Gemmatimonadota bacterium]